MEAQAAHSKGGLDNISWDSFLSDDLRTEVDGGRRNEGSAEMHDGQARAMRQLRLGKSRRKESEERVMRVGEGEKLTRRRE